MTYTFDAGQLNQIDAYYNAAPTDRSQFAQAYGYIYDAIAPGGVVAAGANKSVAEWFWGAAKVNGDDGSLYSNFIRDYTSDQHLIRYGTALDKAHLDALSDAIAVKVLGGIVSTHNAPNLTQIANDDASGAVASDFGGDYGAWSGNILFVMLGDTTPFHQNIINQPHLDTYNLFAAIESAYSAYESAYVGAAYLPMVSVFKNAFPAMWSNDVGFKASYTLLKQAFADADSYMTTAFNGAVSTSDVAAAAYRGRLYLGTTGADTHLQGSSHDDIMNGGAGNDSISGLTGDDVIAGGAGDDVLAGGTGDDLLVGGIGGDTYSWSLGGGHDTILDNGDGSGDTLNLDLTGGHFSSQDIAFTWSGVNLVISFAGDSADSIQIDYARAERGSIEHLNIVGATDTPEITDSFAAGSTLQGAFNAPDILVGTAGNDTMNGNGGNDEMFGFGGDDNLTEGNYGNSYFDGGAGNDTIVGCGGDDHDVMIGGSGNDTLISCIDGLIGETGTVQMLGGGGDDVIDASFGPNPALTTGGWVDAGSGNDQVNVRGVVSHLQGGTGNDGVTFFQAVLAEKEFSVESSGFEAIVPVHTSGNGTQWVDGDSENNNFDFSGFNPVGNFLSLVINAQAGNDTITGMNQGDTIYGAAGNDTLNGADGNDTLGGGDGKDTLNGGNGNDVLDGGTGDDIINGGAGFDIMTGGGGSNIFVFAAASDSMTSVQLPDQITDFNAFHDKIDLWFTVTAIDHVTDPSQATLQPGHVAIYPYAPGSNTVYLLVDGNGVPGFQGDSGDMFVILQNVQNLDKLTVSDFI